MLVSIGGLLASLLTCLEGGLTFTLRCFKRLDLGLDCVAAVLVPTSLLPSGPAGDAWKMSVSGLKAELKFLESIFDPNHERFRIIDWKPDELNCQFNVTGEKLLIIHCNLTVSRETRRHV